MRYEFKSIEFPSDQQMNDLGKQGFHVVGIGSYTNFEGQMSHFVYFQRELPEADAAPLSRIGNVAGLAAEYFAAAPSGSAATNDATEGSK